VAEKRTAAQFFPPSCDLDDLHAGHAGGCDVAGLCDASRHCQGCDLYVRATQTVFGEGNPQARLLLVGEVPGDAEDVAGHPFVGPAGGLLDDLLEEAGILRPAVWVTNAVKHFKYEQRGTKRIHKKPTTVEIQACRPWLDAEIEIVEPEVVVALGATAAQSLLGRDFRITHHRGEWAAGEPVPRRKPRVMATWHPSAVLRAPEREDRHRMRAELVADIRKVASALK